MKNIIPLLIATVIILQPLTTYAENEQIFSETVDGATFSYTVGADMNATITGCSSDMNEILIPSSLGGYMVTSIGESAFSINTEFSYIVIPEGITYIGDKAFSGCLELKSIKIPETVTHLGNGCFTSCISLENVQLNNSLLSIPDQCFYACTALKNITIPESVIFIGNEAFFGCSDISGIFIPPTVEIISENALGMHSVRNYGIEKINNFQIRGLPETSADVYAGNTGIELYCKSGDINYDSFVDAVDASVALGEYASMSTGGTASFDKYQQFVGDYNGDGVIDAVDATLILIEYARLQTLQGEET